MIKTELFTATDEVVIPGVEDNTITVADFDTPVAVVIEPDRLDDKLILVRQGYDDTNWKPVTDGIGNVILSAKRCDAVITVPGVYALSGRVRGTLLAYSITV